jgi:hypothetical protein
MNADLSSSLSAQLQTKLTVWRNPQGKEDNWIENREKYQKYPPVWTIVKCEGGYAALAAIAGVEWSTSRLLFPFGYALSCLTHRPVHTLNHWARCSEMAARWAIANLGYNLTQPNMITTPENFRIEKNRKNLLVNPFTLKGEAPLGD